MSPQEIDRIARQIASGTPPMTIPGYARASATIRRMIDQAAQDILDEEKRKAALAAKSELENGTVKPAPKVVNTGENGTPSFKLPGFS